MADKVEGTGAGAAGAEESGAGAAGSEETLITGAGKEAAGLGEGGTGGAGAEGAKGAEGLTDAEKTAAATKAAADKAAADTATVKAAYDAMKPEEKTAYDALSPEQKAAKDKEILAAKTAAPEKKEGSPEKYTDFKLPEGVALDQASDEEFKATAKKFNLSQDQAQDLVNLYLKNLEKMSKASEEGFKQMKAGWAADAKKELGAKFEEELAYVAKARNQFGDEELNKFLLATGAGNYKAVIRFFAKVGRAVSEDNFPKGSGAGGGSKTAAEIMYPDKKK
ncbi:conserved hypothetical protein [Gammaproteobacteria bacterium]